MLTCLSHLHLGSKQTNKVNSKTLAKNGKMIKKGAWRVACLTRETMILPNSNLLDLIFAYSPSNN